MWLSFDPQAGREQAGRRPAVVLSPQPYHQATNFAVVCPITSTVKGYPFEVILPDGLGISGAILADQVKSIDRNVRNIEAIGSVVPEHTLAEVSAKLAALLALDQPT